MKMQLEFYAVYNKSGHLNAKVFSETRKFLTYFKLFLQFTRKLKLANFNVKKQ